jgi:hypothetical protein
MQKHARFSLTAIGTVRGRVSARELCMSLIEGEVDEILVRHSILDGAPFSRISLVIHLGEARVDTQIWGIDPELAELEVAIGVPFAEVRRKDRKVGCDVIRKAAIEAVTAVAFRYDLPVRPLAEAVPASE